MKTIITLALALTVSSIIANAQTQSKKGSDMASAGTATNPYVQPAQQVTGQPIGGIVVKGGQNGVAANAIHNNPLYNPSGTETQNPLAETKARVAGSPIGGIVVKGGQNGLAAEVKPENPTFNPVGQEMQNVVANTQARTDGNPIGGIIVKGGSLKTEAMVTGNPIPGVGVVVKHNIADRIIANNNTTLATDAALLSFLGVDKLIIKKGTYSPDADGVVTLPIERIVHRDIAARNILLKGYDAETQTSFDYTVEPVFVNGVADQIKVSYKGISEKGIK